MAKHSEKLESYKEQQFQPFPACEHLFEWFSWENIIEVKEEGEESEDGRQILNLFYSEL